MPVLIHPVKLLLHTDGHYEVRVIIVEHAEKGKYDSDQFLVSKRSHQEGPATRALSPPQRLKVFFREDPLSNVSAGTGLQATAESAGASARYHAQDGCHPGGR